jgi:hypothetical protein
MKSDAVENLRQVVRLADERRELAAIFARCRRANETDRQTLERLLEERRAVVAILDTIPQAILERGFADFEYRANFSYLVGKHLGPAKQATKEEKRMAGFLEPAMSCGHGTAHDEFNGDTHPVGGSADGKT